MKEFVYPRDRVLTLVTILLGSAIWLIGLSLLTKGAGARSLGVVATMVVIIAAFAFLGYLFARSAIVAHFKGNGIEVTEGQFAEIHRQFEDCCAKLALPVKPRLFVMNGNGVLNAFATWFLGRKYVILLSSVVDAMDENPSGVRFYLGHELAHVVRHDNPLQWVLRWPALCLPLLGASFSRARETTCDLHGLACSESPEGAARSLVALAAGAKRWKQTSLAALETQLGSASGFWMSFHELTASYPWTAKRVLRVLHKEPQLPRRNPFAYLLAALVPYAGRLGSGLGFLLYVYVIGILAAVAIPAYQDYTVRAALTQVIIDSQPARDALAARYLQTRTIPSSLDSVGIKDTTRGGATMQLSTENMSLTVQSARGVLVFTPRRDSEGRIVWKCSPASEFRPGQLPPSCR
jgi:Zn-dependent protease with chaperone function/Tfp pilus assembly major pilin PilA